MGSYEDGGDWNDEGIQGIFRFVKRVWRLVHVLLEDQPAGTETEKFQNVQRQMHYAIKHCSQSLERFQFNTAISRIMELVNEMYLYIQDVKPEEQNKALLKTITPVLVQLMAPFTPHMAEELWQQLEKSYSIFNSDWPTHDESMLILDTIQMGVQVNGKIRGQIQVPAEMADEEIIKMALANDKVQKYTEGKTFVKQIVIPKKLVVLVVK